MTTNIRFEDWERRKLQDSEFLSAVEDLEPAYQVTRLRIKRGLSQSQLADLVGTHQSSIARLESGRARPSLSFLRRVVVALNGRLSVLIEDNDEIIGQRIPGVAGLFGVGTTVASIPTSRGKGDYQLNDDNLSESPIIREVNL